jgi:Cellulose binding domain/Cellulase (glycosyl hydrolase family 5)
MLQRLMQRLHHSTQHRIALVFITLPLLFIMLCTLIIVSLRAPSAHAASSFVTHQGTQFSVNGVPFQVAGSNNYYPIIQPQVMVDDLFANAQAMGLNTMRIWASADIGSLDGTTVKSIDGKKGAVYFQYWDTTTNAPVVNTGATGLQMLDYAIYSAKQHNIRLVLPFVNNWKDFGGMDQYNIWYGLTNHDAFYTNANTQAAYKNYVSTLINHVNSITGVAYKNDPTIMTWELANEPRCAGSSTSASSSCNTSTITTWANTMSTYIKSLDPNHLVAVGDEGFLDYGNGSDYMYTGSAGVDDQQLAALPNIDYVTYHMYPQGWNETYAWATTWIQNHILLANSVGKPAVMEEFGITASDQANRDVYYPQWLNQICGQFSNWQFWILSARSVDSNGNLAGLYQDYDGYTIYYHDASGNVTTEGSMMANIAAKFNSGQCTGVPTPTPTLIPTTTPIPPVTNGALQVAIQQSGLDNAQESDMNVRVTNVSSSAISNVSFRLYFTLDGREPMSNYVIDRYGDYFTGGGSGTSTAIGPTANAYTDAYYTISLGSSSLPSGATWTWNGRLRLSTWASDYSSANDWWHTIFSNTYANTQYVPAYINGAINWGQAPGVIGSGTPIPTSTPGTITPTATSVPPTSTPVKPTSTPVIPTSTSTAPTSTPTPKPTSTPATGTACKATYAIQSQWSGGFSGNITLANTGSATINGWTLKYAFPATGQSVTQGWSGTWSQSGQNVTVTNLSWNSTIAPGSSTTIGFNGAFTTSNPAPTSFTLNGVTCTNG